MYTAENQRFAEHIGVSKNVFAQPTVVLELPRSAAPLPDAAVGFMLAANLLSRIFAKVYLVAPALPVGPNAWQIADLPDLIDPLSGVSEGNVSWGIPANVDIAVGVGAPPTVASRYSTFFSFSGWDACLDCEVDAKQPGPMGALFAACYGTAQAFIYAARMAGAEYHPMRPFRLSLLNYEDVGPSLACPAELDLHKVHLVGVGAVGSALIYSLCHFPSVTGLLYAIDNDFVDATNLNRYILMRKNDSIPCGPNQKTGLAKVDVAVRAFAKHRIKIDPHTMNFEEFRLKHPEPVELLLTPVDSEAGRRKLACSIPRLVLNASTGHTKVTISRHHFADGKACLSCLYLPPQDEQTTETRLANDLGLTVREVEEFMADNRPIDAATARRIERHRGFEDGSLSAWVGQHIQSFYQRAVCSEAAITTAAGTVISPLSFISAAAGVMLTAELVKASVPELHAFSLDNYFRIDTMMNPNPAFKSMRLQEPTGRCICWDEDYSHIYRQRFGIGIHP